MAQHNENKPLDRLYLKDALAEFLKEFKKQLTGAMDPDLDPAIKSCFNLVGDTYELKDDATLIMAINEIAHNGIQVVSKAYDEIQIEISRQVKEKEYVPTIYVVSDNHTTAEGKIDCHKYSLYIPITRPVGEDPMVLQYALVDSLDYRIGNRDDLKVKDANGNLIKDDVTSPSFVVESLNELDRKQGDELFDTRVHQTDPINDATISQALVEGQSDIKALEKLTNTYVHKIDGTDDTFTEFSEKLLEDIGLTAEEIDLVQADNFIYQEVLKKATFIKDESYNDWKTGARLNDSESSHLYIITDDFEWPIITAVIQYGADDPITVRRAENHDSEVLPGTYAYIDEEGYVYRADGNYSGNVPAGSQFSRLKDGHVYLAVDYSLVKKPATYKAGSWIYSVLNTEGNVVWKALNNGGGEDYLYIKVDEEPVDPFNTVKTNVLYVWPINGEDIAHVYLKGDTEEESKWLSLGGAQGTNWIGSFYFYRLLNTYSWHQDPDNPATTQFVPVWSDEPNMVYKFDSDNDADGNHSPYAFYISTSDEESLYRSVVERVMGLDAAASITIGSWLRTPYSLLDEFVRQNTISDILPTGRDSEPGDLVTLYVGTTPTAQDSAYIGQYLYKDATNGWKIYSSLSKANYTVEGITRYANDTEYDDPEKVNLALDPKHLDKYADKYIYKRTVVKDILGNTSPTTTSEIRTPTSVPGLSSFLINATGDPKESFTLEFTDGTSKIINAPSLSKYLDEFFDTSAEVNAKLKALRKSKVIVKGVDFTSNYPEDMSIIEKDKFLGYVLYWECDHTDADHPEYIVGQMYSYIVDSEGNIQSLGASTVEMEDYIKNDNDDWVWLTDGLDKTEINLETRLEGLIKDGVDTNRPYLEKNKVVVTAPDNTLMSGGCSRNDTYALNGWNAKYDGDTGVRLVDELDKKANLSNSVEKGIKTVNGKSLIITDVADNNIIITTGVTEVAELPVGEDIDDSALYRVTSTYSTAKDYDKDPTGIYMRLGDRWAHFDDVMFPHIVKSVSIANLDALNDWHQEFPSIIGSIKVDEFAYDGITYNLVKGSIEQRVEYLGTSDQIIEATGLIDTTKKSTYTVMQKLYMYEYMVGSDKIKFETPIQVVRYWDGTVWTTTYGVGGSGGGIVQVDELPTGDDIKQTNIYQVKETTELNWWDGTTWTDLVGSIQCVTELPTGTKIDKRCLYYLTPESAQGQWAYTQMSGVFAYINNSWRCIFNNAIDPILYPNLNASLDSPDALHNLMVGRPFYIWNGLFSSFTSPEDNTTTITGMSCIVIGGATVNYNNQNRDSATGLSNSNPSYSWQMLKFTNTNSVSDTMNYESFYLRTKNSTWRPWINMTHNIKIIDNISKAKNENILYILV